MVMSRQQLQRTSAFQARIRMSEPVWRFIIENKNPPDLGRDLLQCKLDRLVRENPDARDRILVTGDDNVLDLLRDWCARIIAEKPKLLSAGQKIRAQTLCTEAGRVIGLLDRHDAKMMQIDRSFNR